MKLKLKRITSKRRADVRKRIHKMGGLMFDELGAVLSKGYTEMVVLDLNGDPVEVKADIVGLVPTRRRRKADKPNRFERAVQKVLAQNEIEVDITTAQAIALLTRTYVQQENLLKKYKYKKSGN